VELCRAQCKTGWWYRGICFSSYHISSLPASPIHQYRCSLRAWAPTFHVQLPFPSSSPIGSYIVSPHSACVACLMVLQYIYMYIYMRRNHVYAQSNARIIRKRKDLHASSSGVPSVSSVPPAPVCLVFLLIRIDVSSRSMYAAIGAQAYVRGEARDQQSYSSMALTFHSCSNLGLLTDERYDE
jgi:hypothetical protein